jgi:hypothetical protein
MYKNIKKFFIDDLGIVYIIFIILFFVVLELTTT